MVPLQMMDVRNVLDDGDGLPDKFSTLDRIFLMKYTNRAEMVVYVTMDEIETNKKNVGNDSPAIPNSTKQNKTGTITRTAVHKITTTFEIEKHLSD